MAEPNGIVIGGDLHQVMQFSFTTEYKFRELQGYSVDLITSIQYTYHQARVSPRWISEHQRPI